jgi:nitroreductase
MEFSRPVSELIVQRSSCRTYLDLPIDKEKRDALERFMKAGCSGPFGTRMRFGLIASQEGDRGALKGLGTYGVIKDAAGFILGATTKSPMSLEDFGYALERIILFATDLELGTCWLGGTFTKSRFARRFGIRDGEELPAAVSVGYPSEQPTAIEAVSRRYADSHNRLPWEDLFFDGDFGSPMTPEAAGAYAAVLEMVRIAPSASNKQPWRIVRRGNSWHLFLERSATYRSWMPALARIADMPRVDMGIAMCHFELAAREQGLEGRWQLAAPEPAIAGAPEEYSATWVSEG